MARPSDKEYTLLRKIKDLEVKNRQLEVEIAQLVKKLERETPAEDKKKKAAPVRANPCPDCGAAIKETELPFGKLQICAAGCGWRLVKRN